MKFQDFGWYSSQRYPSGRNEWKLYGQFILGQDDSQPGSRCDPDLPHSQCYIIHDAPFSHGPLKSEILGITMSMYEKMSDEYYNNHRLFPVCLFPIPCRYKANKYRSFAILSTVLASVSHRLVLMVMFCSFDKPSQSISAVVLQVERM